MCPKETEEGQEEPGGRVFIRARGETGVRFAIHGGDEKKVHDPANEKEAAGKEPQDAGQGFAEVKTVSTCESEDPEDITNSFVVSGDGSVIHSETMMELGQT